MITVLISYNTEGQLWSQGDLFKDGDLDYNKKSRSFHFLFLPECPHELKLILGDV